MADSDISKMPRTGRHNSDFPERYQRLLDLLIDRYPEKRQSGYLINRWGDRLRKSYWIAAKNKFRFYLLRTCLIGTAAVLPSLVTWQTTGTGPLGPTPGLVAAALSIVAAGLAGLLEVLKPGERWRLYQQLRYDLEHAAWDLLNATGKCTHAAEHADSYYCFVERIESLLGEHAGNYFGDIARIVAKNEGREGPVNTMARGGDV